MARRAALTRFRPVHGNYGRKSLRTNISALLSKALSPATCVSAGNVPATSWDITPSPVFNSGDADTYDVASTGPVSLGYLTGGIYDSASGTALPSGLTLSTDGILSDSGAAVSTTSNVVFGYTEPGALPILTLHSGTPSGTLPYMATVYPVEGAVPNGTGLESPQDATLRSSVLSRWPDNSAQVMIVAGHKSGIVANSTTALTLRTAVVSDTPLTLAYIDSLLTSIVFTNFGGGTQTFNNFTGGHDRTWWSNSQVICARYRQSLNVGAMEAVIDVHAFAGGRVFVEVVIENSRLDSANAIATKPTSQTYTAATVSVNGSAITPSGGVNSSHTYYPGGVATTQPNHEAFRAWYCSGWVGGDPGIDVTHDTTSLQAHPWFWKSVRTQIYSTAAYGSFSYSPWVDIWHARSGMSGTGEATPPALSGYGLNSDQTTWIGPVPAWEAAYIMCGDTNTRKACLVAGQEALKLNINYRDTTTNIPPSSTQLQGKVQPTTWPRTSTEPAMDEEHQPALGLIPFLCRPSPCFIELAQKSMVWVHSDVNSTGYNNFSTPRQRAWRYRDYAAAVFLTPDTSAPDPQESFKTSGRTVLWRAVSEIDTFRNTAWNTLELVWGNMYNSTGSAPDYSNWDHISQASRSRMQRYLWGQQWIVLIAHMIDHNKILRGTNGTDWTSMADWLCRMPVRFITDPATGAWRVYGYSLTYGDIDVTGTPFVNMGTGNWGDMMESDYTGTSLTETGGGWVYRSTSNLTWPADTTAATVMDTYSGPLWAALCVAKERGVSGATTAWNRVQNGITNLTTWLDTAASNPRYNRLPRL